MAFYLLAFLGILVTSVSCVQLFTQAIEHRASISDILLAFAVIMSVTSATPFRGTNDQNLSVAYLSAFSLVFMVCLTMI